MIGHGALVMLVAFAAGVGLLASLLGGLELVPGEIIGFDLFGPTDAWVRAHLGGILNAIMVIVVALALPAVGFGEAGARRIGFAIVATAWANTLFYWAALLSPNRALSFGDNRFGESNWIAVAGLAPALLFTVVVIVTFIAIARRAFARA
ncbi:hypothetical protein DKG75_13385 [Zavarzinia compransoris]|uniref:Isomerase n=2 Tax=Zavarzinia compransoris TaxID=1264899 RepID=A0A317E1K0_9PROT|nr:hypothetical protein DKG75_13385 [Zavarzinia compransoris]